MPGLMLPVVLDLSISANSANVTSYDYFRAEEMVEVRKNTMKKGWLFLFGPY